MLRQEPLSRLTFHAPLPVDQLPEHLNDLAASDPAALKVRAQAARRLIARTVAPAHRACLILAATIAILAGALFPAPSAAQPQPEFFDVPFAPGQWEVGRRFDESQLRYCVDKRDPDWEMAADIADAIAQALLLEPKRYVVTSEVVLEDITKLYGIMLKHCDLHMGFKLIPEGYPNWVILTRPYYETGYAFVTADPGIGSLADLAPGTPIAATIGTMAHIRLVAYNSALPADKRWPIFPMGSNELALTSLLNGTAAVGLVWAPSLWVMQRDDAAFAAIQVIDPAPLPPTTIGVGGLLLSNEKFLRTAIDDAIAALNADGTIQSIVDRYKFPATATP